MQHALCPEDLVARRPVWKALGELFLDTEFSGEQLAAVSQTLADSCYSVAQLEEILYAEVYPVCIGNLRSPAGVWSGFDEGWLEKRIQEYRQSWLKWPVCLQMGRGLIREDWEQVKVVIGALRSRDADVEEQIS